MSAIKNISLYIPHVFPNFDKEYVAKAFKNIGEVSQIDFVAKQDRNGGNYNAVYVHFNKWYTNKKAVAFYESVVAEAKEARLYHDDSVYYWIVLPNKAKKHMPGERKQRIDVSNLKAISGFETPLKQEPIEEIPPTPMKPTFADVISKPTSELKRNLDVNFEDVAKFEAEIEAEMDEIEKFFEEEDKNLIKIDGRYVQNLEQENWAMSAEISELRAALIKLDQMYQAEVAKVRAFSSNSVDL